MRVLVVDQNPEDACSWYRCSGPWAALARTGKAEVVFNDAPHWRDIRGFDWLFMIRPHLEQNLRTIRDALWHGVRVWTDFDDNLFAIPPENHARITLGSPMCQAIMRQAIQLSDVVTVSTVTLKEALLKLVPEQDTWRVIPNALDESFLRSRATFAPSKVPTILWRGSSTHLADLETYREQIVDAAKTFPEAVWLFMGTEPWFSAEINSRILPPQPLFKYFGYLASLTANIGIVPLQDHAFNHAKSDIAAMELSFAGAKCLVPSFWEPIPGTVSYNDKVEFGIRLKEMLQSVSHDTSTLSYYSTHRSLKQANKLRLEILGDPS